MHANPDWLPPAYKNWDALLTDAVRKGMKDGKAPADVAQWSYGSWHVVDIEHPLAGFLPLVGRMAGTGAQPLSGDTTTVKQVGRDFGPSQRFTMDWSNIDGSTENIVLGESGNPFSPYFRDQWNDWYGGTTFALPFTPPAVAAQTRAHAAPAAMKARGSGNRDQGSGKTAALEPFCRPRPFILLRRGRGLCAAICCTATPAATTSISISSPGSMRSRVGGRDSSIRTGRPAPTSAPASRVSSFIRR